MTALDITAQILNIDDNGTDDEIQKQIDEIGLRAFADLKDRLERDWCGTQEDRIQISSSKSPRVLHKLHQIGLSFTNDKSSDISAAHIKKYPVADLDLLSGIGMYVEQASIGAHEFLELAPEKQTWVLNHVEGHVVIENTPATERNALNTFIDQLPLNSMSYLNSVDYGWRVRSLVKNLNEHLLKKLVQKGLSFNYLHPIHKDDILTEKIKSLSIHELEELNTIFPIHEALIYIKDLLALPTDKQNLLVKTGIKVTGAGTIAQMQTLQEIGVLPCLGEIPKVLQFMWLTDPSHPHELLTGCKADQYIENLKYNQKICSVESGWKHVFLTNCAACIPVTVAHVKALGFEVVELTDRHYGDFRDDMAASISAKFSKSNAYTNAWAHPAADIDAVKLLGGGITIDLNTRIKQPFTDTEITDHHGRKSALI